MLFSRVFFVDFTFILSIILHELSYFANVQKEVRTSSSNRPTLKEPQ